MNNYKKISNAHKDYIEGMSYNNIASKYGVKLNTVKSWVYRYKWAKSKYSIPYK